MNLYRSITVRGICRYDDHFAVERASASQIFFCRWRDFCTSSFAFLCSCEWVFFWR